MIAERFLTLAMRAASRSFAESNRPLHPGLNPLGNGTHGKPGRGTPQMLYIHIPFCRELCPFCSFHRIRFIESVAETYFDSLEIELDFHLRNGAQYRKVYIGGGTPTILPRRLMGLIYSLRRRWPVESLSIEANPDALEADTLSRLGDAGIDRLSVGIQSFDDKLLDSMNRLAKYGSGRSLADTIASARIDRFKTFNVDLIFNLPGQSDESIARDAQIIRKLPVDQTTWYPLMPSSPMAVRNARREFRQYRLIDSLLGEDFSPSSAWCFSRSKSMIDEYIIDSPEYAAAGSGAFGYIDGRLYANTFSIAGYCRSLASEGMSDLALLHRFTPVEVTLYRTLMTLFSGRIPRRSESDYLLRAIGGVAAAMGITRRGGPRNRMEPAGSNRIPVSERERILTTTGRYWILVLMREFFTGVNTLRRTCRNAVANELTMPVNASGVAAGSAAITNG